MRRFLVGLLALWMAFCAAPGAASATLLTGDIAFLGFNADGDDDFAIVALADIGLNETITFIDAEWTGTEFNSGEGDFTWTATSPVSAGTVITFNSIGSSGARNVSTGSIDGGASFSSSGETIWAVAGTRAAPGTFLAGLSTLASDVDAVAPELITGSGLLVGSTMTLLTEETDVAQYVGPRSGLPTFAAYRPLLANPANWAMFDGSGDQSLSAVPFNTTALTVPEPATWSMTLLAAAGLLVLLRRRR